MNKIIGFNWFHRHPKMEDKLGVDEKHVIIDEHEYRQIVNYLTLHPDIAKEIMEQNL